MGSKISYEESEYSLENLEKFRDKNGFIDLDKAGIILTSDSRENVGTQDRIKNWVNFAGTKVLIKGETKLDNDENYTIYAELIVEEIAKQLGLPAAHYDLVKKDGKLGVLSVSVLNDSEDLINLHDIIGDEENENTSDPDVTSFDFTINKLTQKLKDNGYSKEEIKKIITDYRIQTVFSLAVLDQDKHTENISIIKNKNGKGLRMAPIFDSEHALLLDLDVKTVHNLINGDYNVLKKVVETAHPRIGNFREDGFESLWADTIESVYEEPQVTIEGDRSFDIAYDFCKELIDQDLGKITEQACTAIEKRIHAELPKDVKQLAKYAVLTRQNGLSEILEGKREYHSNKKEMPDILKQLYKSLLTPTITEMRESFDTIAKNCEENLKQDINFENDEKNELWRNL